MPQPNEPGALERAALRLALRALGEFVSAPVRSKPALFESLLAELLALAGCESAFAAERVVSAGGASALRVIAAVATAARAGSAPARGIDLQGDLGVIADALRSATAAFTNAPTDAPFPNAPALANALALPLVTQSGVGGVLALENRAAGWDDAMAQAFRAIGEAGGDLLLGFQRAAARARAEEDLFRSQQHLRRAATLDGLTGLANRASTLRALDDAATRSHAAGLPVAVLFADLDHAKRLSDRVGGPGFDEVLKRAARVLRETLRPTDWLGRWGVDAFVALLLGCDADLGAMVAERIRLRIEGATFPVWGGADVLLTASAGVASSQLAAEDGAALAARAAGAAEEAKRAGRNRVCVSRPARA